MNQLDATMIYWCI